jgi:hypothetical protein
MASISKSTKLIVVPTDLADTLKIIAGRIGVGLPEYIEEALTQAVLADKEGASLKETVDLLKMINIHKDAGSQIISRSDLNTIINQMPKRKIKLLEKIWLNSGSWYGNYLKTRLDLESIIQFLETDLLLTWSLDDVIIERNDVELILKCVSFNQTEASTNLLQQYLSGLMKALGFRETDKIVLRGLINIRYLFNDR